MAKSKEEMVARKKAYNKTYREKHREELLAKKKAYRQEHREEIAAYHKAYREKQKQASTCTDV